MDIEFDDYADLGFAESKDVHINAIEIYETNTHINGMEVYYVVDGEILKYSLHYKTKKS